MIVYVLLASPSIEREQSPRQLQYIYMGFHGFKVPPIL